MNKDKILELLKMLFEINEKDLFIAQMLYEKCDFKHEVSNIIDSDFEYAEKIYETVYLENDNCNSKWNDDIWAALNNEYDFEEV